MSVLKKNDFIAVCDASGKYLYTIPGPHPTLVPVPIEFDNGKPIKYRYDVADKGYNQPHKVNGNNNDIAVFGAYHRRRYWKKHRTNRHKKAA